MKTKIAIATLAFALTAGSALARPAYSSHPYRSSIYCATREAGNPHSRLCDYISWSSWRRRGSWDASLDNACLMNPGFIPSECNGRL
jgi:hypothetical protein